MKSLAFTSSSLFTNKTTNSNKDTCKSPGNHNGEEEKVFVKRIPDDEHDAILDFSKEVGLTKSDRLLFSPGHGTKSIMEEALLNKRKDVDIGAKIGSFKGGVAMAMESRDPYRDFRDSMEEMVAAHGGGVRADWEWLQEMLAWYLGANGRTMHGAILGAFVDLLMSLTKSESCNYNLYSNHVSSSCSSNCSCFSFEIEDKNEKPHI